MDSAGGWKQRLYRFTREHNNREYAENCSKWDKDAFDTGDDEREPIMTPPRERSTGEQGTKRHRQTGKKEQCAEHNEKPAENRSWRVVIIPQSCRVASRIKHESTHCRIEAWKKRS